MFLFLWPSAYKRPPPSARRPLLHPAPTAVRPGPTLFFGGGICSQHECIQEKKALTVSISENSLPSLIQVTAGARNRPSLPTFARLEHPV